MDIEKLELINLLKEFNRDELTQVMLIMSCWDELVNMGVVSKDDIDNLGNLSVIKQNDIIKYIKTKLNNMIERKDNGNKEKEKL